jgi:hypothetical protein
VKETGRAGSRKLCKEKINEGKNEGRGRREVK